MGKHSWCKPCGICTCPGWREIFPTEIGADGECLTCDGSGVYHYCGDANYRKKYNIKELCAGMTKDKQHELEKL